MIDTSYDRIGAGYDHTRKADPYICDRLEALLTLDRSSKVIDVGCGTGNYTRELQRSGFSMTGLDPSERMLKEARRSADVQWIQATAEDIPIETGSFDGAIATLTIHHWKDLPKGMSEVRRVLKPEGTFVIFTSTPEQMRSYWLCHYFPEMMKRSIAVMPSKERTTSALRDVGLTRIVEERYFIHPDLIDNFLYSGKDAPLKYLDPIFRRGISSFSALASEVEVVIGLERLKSDVGSGNWERIRNEYDPSLGDYLFLIAS